MSDPFPIAFDLRTEAWLPCWLGDVPRDLSLREVLAQAHEIDEMSDPSPLVTAALHRLLLAILHDAYLGPEDDADWRAIWARGHFGDEPLDYLDARDGLFDLFDGEKPFYQRGGLSALYKPRPLRNLAHESRHSGAVPEMCAADADEGADGDEWISAAEAARLLVAFQPYALGGLTSRLPGEPQSATAAPLVNAEVVLLRGQNLFETLCLNMAPYVPDEEDLPAWDGGPTENADRAPTGRLDWLTWQSRRLLLSPPGVRDGRLYVRQIRVCAGWALGDAEDLRELESQTGWRWSDKESQWFPVGMREEHPTWRDLAAMMARPGYQMPGNVAALLQRVQVGVLPADTPVALNVLGMVTDQFRLLCWRRERFPLPLDLLDPEKLRTLTDCVEYVERAGRLLRQELADLGLSPAGAQRAYWSELEVPFRLLLGDPGEDARSAWEGLVAQAALRHFHSGANSAGPLARANASGHLRRSLSWRPAVTEGKEATGDQ